MTDFLKGVDLHTILNIAAFGAFTLAGAFALILVGKMAQIRGLKKSLQKLQRSFSNLDEQAKLIIKTDIALNKAQEEIDKRLSALNALHKTSALISTTLDASEIFKRLGKSLATELGFEKNMILMFDKNNNLQCRSELGFTKEIAQQAATALLREQIFRNVLGEGHTLSSLNATKQKREKIFQLFKTEHFILSPILTQDGIIGVLFVGNQTESTITQGDEELISILTNQIGQSLENAELFEQVYHSRQELESKIQERTRELTLALEELKKTSKAKTDFVSAVSHELRTPLTSIKGYASLLMTGKIGEIPPQVKERLEKINKHSDNLVQFINNLLDISRIESGRMEMNLEKCSLPHIVENIRDLLMPQMKEKNIHFAIEISPTIAPLAIEKNQIERVFINLLSNAIKFTPPQGTIAIKIYQKSNGIICEVSDTGIGIAENDVPKLFDEFYRVENEINQVVKGTGLGLTLVKKIIEAHAGKIWVTSKVGSGTTFHFTLPLPKENKLP